MPKRLTPRGEAAPPVEPIITGATLPSKESAAKRPQRKPKATDTGVRYVRNLHHIKVRVTLATGRDIILEPRGQREDLDIVNKDEQEDPRFFANRGLIFEVITTEEAQAIIYKQQTNAKVEHPLWQHLRNEQGDPYEQRATKIEEVFERQGEVVGRVEETGAGRFTDRNSQVVRTSGASPTIAQVPGSPNHPATNLVASVPSYVSPEEYHEFLAFRQWKALAEESARLAEATPEEVRASLNLTVEPVQQGEDGGEE